jgi:hypothetical protein
MCQTPRSPKLGNSRRDQVGRDHPTLKISRNLPLQ